MPEAPPRNAIFPSRMNSGDASSKRPKFQEVRVLTHYIFLAISRLVLTAIIQYEPNLRDSEACRRTTQRVTANRQRRGSLTPGRRADMI